MKAEDLMRNDWVCIVNENAPKQVDWIRSGEVGLLWGQTVTPPYLKPIPLTPEILEKNGFEEDDGAYIYYNAQYDDYVNWCGTILKIGCDNGNMELADVQYVHELQHALHLCGIEKEIEL